MRLIHTYRKRFEDLQEYVEAVLDSSIKLTIPWKIHVLVIHLPQWLRIHQKGLSDFSEQTAEACHHFLKTYRRFSRAETHPEHGKRLRRSVVGYSSRRI